MLALLRLSVTRRVLVFAAAAFFSLTILGTGAVPVQAEFFCWCRTTGNVCSNHERTGTYDPTTSATACDTFCRGRGETVIATERPYGTTYQTRAIDICSNRGITPSGAPGPCFIGGSCAEVHGAISPTAPPTTSAGGGMCGCPSGASSSQASFGACCSFCIGATSVEYEGRTQSCSAAPATPPGGAATPPAAPAVTHTSICSCLMGFYNAAISIPGGVTVENNCQASDTLITLIQGLPSSRTESRQLTLSPAPAPGTSVSEAQSICRAQCIAFGTRLNDESVTTSVRCLSSTYTEGTTGSTTPGGPVFGSGNTNSSFTAANPGAAAGRAGRAATLSDPLGGVSVPQLLGRVINAFLGLSGSLGLLVFIYGGFLWLTSGGSPEKITQGRNAIVWATLGLLLIFGAYAIVNFVLRTILGAAAG